jgi:dihydropteroate synthase
MIYWRPLVQSGLARPQGALALAGGALWFTHLEALERGRPPQVVPAAEAGDLSALTAARADFAGMAMDAPRIMGILNVTPDSFSDGGRFHAPQAALAQARALAAAADILDIGGESTRPGAAPVAIEEEIARTAPVIAALRAGGLGLPISIDTRKAAVAAAALDAGAQVVNDVAALTYDAGLGPLAAARGAPVVLMHHQGTPETMQADPRYDDVLLDVYDWLAETGWPRPRRWASRAPGSPSIPASALARPCSTIWRFCAGCRCFMAWAARCCWAPAASGSSAPSAARTRRRRGCPDRLRWRLQAWRRGCR